MKITFLTGQTTQIIEVSLQTLQTGASPCSKSCGVRVEQAGKVAQKVSMSILSQSIFTFSDNKLLLELLLFALISGRSGRFCFLGAQPKFQGATSAFSRISSLQADWQLHLPVF